MDETINTVELDEAIKVDTEIAPDPEEIRKEVKVNARKSYNSACLTLLIQFGIASFISGIISGIYTAIVTFKFMMENIDTDPELIGELMADKLLETALNPMFLLVTTIISYLIANLASYFIGNMMTKKHHNVKLFGKIQMKPLDCVLAVVSIIGIQMVSALVQYIVMTVTGMTGVTEETANLLSFSDNMLQNVLLMLYTVVIAAITEELVCRGALMKGLSPISTTFALIASALMFGVMHGNFNQIFNGFLLGLVIGYAAIKSRSIFLPIILHMCANGHAMIWAFLEYKFGKSIMTFELIYMIAVAVIGIGAVAWLVIRNGMPNDKTDGYPVISTIEGAELVENKKGFTWALLFKSPVFWIFIAIYLGTALLSLTPLV